MLSWLALAFIFTSPAATSAPPSVERLAANRDALNSLREARDQQAVGDKTGMMVSLVKALGARPADPIILQGAIEMSKSYYQNQPFPAPWEISSVIDGPWVMVHRMDDVKYGYFHRFSICFRTTAPEKIKRISVVLPNGEEVESFSDTYRVGHRRFPSKRAPGFWTFLSQSPRMKPFVPGLYRFRYEVEGEKLSEFPVILDPDPDKATLPVGFYDSEKNEIAWEMKTDRAFLKDTFRLVVTSLTRPQSARSSFSEETKGIYNTESIAGRKPAKVSSGSYILELNVTNMVFAGRLELYSDSIRQTMVEVP